MPLDSYVTLGRSGLRVSPFTLGTMTFGEEWGWGAERGRVGGDARRVSRARRQLHRHRQRLHQRPRREDRRRLLRPAARAARPGRDRLEVLRQPVRGRPERRWRRPQGDRAAARALAAAPADRLRRHLLAAQLGSRRSGGGDAARRSTTSSPRARSATSASPTCRPGRPPRRRSWRTSAAGRRSSPCSWSTRCSSGPSKAS